MTNVVKHVVVPDFEPILGKKLADVFEAVWTPKSPKNKENSEVRYEPPNWSEWQFYELSFAPIVVDNPQFGGAQNEQMRSAFAKLVVVKFK